ncbi:MAG: hypothetical protein ABIO81_01535 [Ginsengibacter sp.]
MTPRSLFNIILKVIGIFFIRNILISASNIVPAIAEVSSEEFKDFGILNLVILLLEFFVYLVLTYILLFRTNGVIDKLKLDHGFKQDTFTLNIDRSIVLRVTIMVLGGLIIVESIPALIQEIIYFIEMKKSGVPNAKNYAVILQVVKLFIGIFLVVFQRSIVSIIEHKQRRNT